MKKITRFDLGAIIAFVVIGLLGAGGWYYFSGTLQDAQGKAQNASQSFGTYSAKGGVAVSPANGKILQSNIDQLQAQLAPLIPAKVQPKENLLHAVDSENPVNWKQDLDDNVHKLLASAKVHGVTLPKNFYFGFSRYLNQSPNEEQTLVLGKQLIAINELSNVLINQPVKAIRALRRTYEEDSHAAGEPISSSGPGADTDRLSGSAPVAAGGICTSYPFEVEFDTTAENLRPILDNLIQSPYIFVVRTITVQNSAPTSPQLGDLDKMANSPSLVDGSPGDAASAPPKGPQFLFGNSILKVKARIDLIDWTAPTVDATNGDNAPGKPVAPGSS